MAVALIIVGASVWMAGMALAIALPVKPSIVKIIEKLVCPANTKMEVTTEVYSYHRPGQRAIHIFYIDENGSERNIGGRAIFFLTLLFFILSLPISIAVVLLIRNLILKS